MNESPSQTQYVARRAELIVELFLHDLGARIVTGPDCADLGYDFLIGFKNAEGGVNLSAVEVKATEKPVSHSYPLPRKWYALLAYSNVPSLLLVVDVKKNRLYHAWPNPDYPTKHEGSGVIRVPVAEVDDATKREIRKRLANPSPALKRSPH